MSDANQKKFNLAWHQHDTYWLIVYSRHERFTPSLVQRLKQAGLSPIHSAEHEALAVRTSRGWKASWDAVYEAISQENADSVVEVALLPGAELLDEPFIKKQAVATVQAIAESLWLGDALLEDRIICYLQPVLSSPDKVFGYESFARVVCDDGSVIAGDRIVRASKALGIEYMIDRHLQVQAIKTFMSSQFNGYLFINFFPGFIHRPSVYLEGLAETVKNFGVLPRHIVLDFTKSETPHDLMHLKNVCEYGRSCGYSIALDDVESLKSLQRLFGEIKPDFVKIDMKLVHQVSDTQSRATIRDIVELVHASGSTVIGEGVETDAMHQSLKQLGVDLFQGYLFSPPVPVEVALKRSAAQS
jgi:EAL domain-containing protein (putative c-di-GMP-specific phosphodiesterase class I)